MKLFAINFLSDYFGQKTIGKYQSYLISAFANFVAYIINREIELSDSLDDFSVESMVKNGVFGDGNGMGYGEHIITIDLRYKNFTDQIEWDICNPDNQPEEFAALLVKDLQLEPNQEYQVSISY